MRRIDSGPAVVRLQVELPSSVDEAWEALTSGGRTIAWLGRLSVDSITEGGRFDLWHDEHVRSGHVVEQWRPRQLLTLTWDFPEERASRVTFALSEATTSTATLGVHHENVDDAVSYAAGWHRHLQYLHAHLSGRDLPIDDFWVGYDDLLELHAEP